RTGGGQVGHFHLNFHEAYKGTLKVNWGVFRGACSVRSSYIAWEREIALRLSDEAICDRKRQGTGALQDAGALLSSVHGFNGCRRSLMVLIWNSCRSKRTAFFSSFRLGPVSSMRLASLAERTFG